MDDHLYAETEQLMPLAVACSVVSVDETFGGNHKYQELVLSEEKLHLLYKKQRILLGNLPDSRSLWSYISSRRREKLLCYLLNERWVTDREFANIRQIAQVNGMIQNASESFHWALAQLLIVQQLLRKAIRSCYNDAVSNHRINNIIIDIRRNMPKNLSYRLRFLDEKILAKYLWSSRKLIPILAEIRAALKVIYDYLSDPTNCWGMPIGHIIDRDYA